MKIPLQIFQVEMSKFQNFLLWTKYYKMYNSQQYYNNKPVGLCSTLLYNSRIRIYKTSNSFRNKCNILILSKSKWSIGTSMIAKDYNNPYSDSGLSGNMLHKL